MKLLNTWENFGLGKIPVSINYLVRFKHVFCLHEIIIIPGINSKESKVKLAEDNNMVYIPSHFQLPSHHNIRDICIRGVRVINNLKCPEGACKPTQSEF